MHIARELIDPDADKVVRRLARHGYQAYLVGGCVRDLLLGRSPKDFDVATSATPSEIKSLFRNCRIIGRRFRLAHIFFGDKIIETSTFRANPRAEDADAEGEILIRRDNVFGTDTEDAQRRDFTINGLFYDVEAERVIDHVGGLPDLHAALVRTIGEPGIRFREDPVRMMRAIKFAARLGFEVEGNTFAALVEHRGEIRKCAAPRVLEEIYRLLRGGAARRSMELLVETGIATMLSPSLAMLLGGGRLPAIDPDALPELDRPEAPEGAREEELWARTWSEEPEKVICGDPIPEPELSFIPDRDELARRREIAWNLLGQLDRVVHQRGASNALVLATLCAPFVVPSTLESGVRPAQANEIVGEVMKPLLEQLRIARRDGERARQIILAQRRLDPARRRRGKPIALVRRDYFDEALTIYELLGEASGVDRSDVEYWRKLQAEDSSVETDTRNTKRRRRRRGGRRRRRNDDSGDKLEPALG